MTLEELREQVIDLVNDPGYTEYQIENIIDQVYSQVCLEVDIPSLCNMVALEVVNSTYGETEFKVNNKIAKVLRIQNTTTSLPVRIHPSLDAMDDYFYGEHFHADRLQVGVQAFKIDEGNITDIAIMGKYIWSRPIPAESNDLLISYYAVPAKLVAETVPDGHPLYNAGIAHPLYTDGANDPEEVPEALQYKILVQGAALRIFDAIEQDEEDTKINTNVMFAAYSTGLQKLREWIGKNRRHHVYRFQAV